MKYLITGGAGFIGTNFLKIMLANYPNDDFDCLDNLTYASNTFFTKLERYNNFTFIKGNIISKSSIYELFSCKHYDFVINFAAESHVDKSIRRPSLFFKTNVRGTSNLLDACVKFKIKRFHQVSTDEVYGESNNPISNGFLESDPLKPSSPYSASKAAADLIVMAYHRTYGLNVTVSRSSNNYGPYQYKEKLIPLVITKALKNEKIPVYGDGTNLRDWIYVDDCCYAIDKIVRNGMNGDKYNISAHNRVRNIDLIKDILDYLKKPYSLINYVKDRKGHDKDYSISTKKIESQLKWEPKYDFKKSLESTIDWYVEQFKENQSHI